MQKKYISIGLMSGTSGDGVDASVISSNGVDKYESIKNKYYQYDDEVYNKIHDLKDQINSTQDLKKNSSKISDLERKITLFHAKIIKNLNLNEDNPLIGFHGQTIYHNAKEKISKQLGDAKLLFQLTKKKIIFNFRYNDIQNGGEGAPLTPIFHKLIVAQKKINLPACILNIGGISNVTIVKNINGTNQLYSKDVGPGNCLIDSWVRKNSGKKFDYNGSLASNGSLNEIILEQAQELYFNRTIKDKLSLDVNDFDVSFARGLSLEDGSKTLTEFTASIISESLLNYFKNLKIQIKDILICGGGRKNKILIESIKNKLSPNLNLKLIDDHKVDGDFVESQAFAFLAIRSYLKLPITFPSTTGCNKPCLGGDLIQN